MRHLSLFTGAGGGELGAILNGWHTVGYVEWDDYCQRVLAQRIKDGILPEAPIFCDVRAFISEGYANAYQGMVDVVSGGFPCQPFSTAGKRKGADDKRNMWPATLECLRRVRPHWALLENVPGLCPSARGGGYFKTILRDLAEAGYDARWTVLGADDVGARHRRKRIWIVAYSINGINRGWARSYRETDEVQEINRQKICSGMSCGTSEISNTAKQGLEGQKPEGEFSGKESGLPAECNWWATEPTLGRVAHGVADRVDRLKSIGNGQVPQVAATAWEILN